jgi:hypothetical protein
LESPTVALSCFAVVEAAWVLPDMAADCETACGGGEVGLVVGRLGYRALCECYGDVLSLDSELRCGSCSGSGDELSAGKQSRSRAYIWTNGQTPRGTTIEYRVDPGSGDVKHPVSSSCTQRPDLTEAARNTSRDIMCSGNEHDVRLLARANGRSSEQCAGSAWRAISS